MAETVKMSDYQLDYDLRRGAPEDSAHELIIPAFKGKVDGLPGFNELIEQDPKLVTYAGKEGGGNFIGHPDFRNNRAEHHNVSPEQIVSVPGGMAGITAYIAYMRYLQVKNKEQVRPIRVLTESPTYDRAVQNLRDPQQCEWTGVPIVDGKLDFDQLESALDSVDLFYMIYEGQNPSSVRYTPEEIQTVKDLCKQKGVKLLLDGAYQNLVYDNNFHGVDYSNEDNASYVFSFTKEVSAGIKRGYLVVPQDAAVDFNYVMSNSRLNPNYLIDKWYAGLLEHPLYQQNLDFLRNRYQERTLITIATLSEINEVVLKQHGLAIDANQELSAGFFSLLNMPEINTEDKRAAMIRSMAERGVAMEQNVDGFHPDHRRASNAWGAFRYPFASQPHKNAIEDALDRIGESLIEVARS